MKNKMQGRKILRPLVNNEMQGQPGTSKVNNRTYMIALAAAAVAAWGICAGMLPAQTPDRPAYRFQAGTQAVYRVYTFDSVMIYDAPPRLVIRQRQEHVRVHCDSVLPDGKRMITITLLAYNATEWFGKAKPVTSNTHPWVGRDITFVMDTAGYRTTLMLPENARVISGSAPGGPLQPVLLPFLGNPDSSASIYTVQTPLFENGLPPVQWSARALRLTKGRLDTLDSPATVVEISEVGALSYKPMQPSGKAVPPVVSAVVNTAAHRWLDPATGYPVCGDNYMIANLTITPPDSSAPRLTGRHILSMLFHSEDPRTLQAIRKNVEAIERANAAAEQKQKASSGKKRRKR